MQVETDLDDLLIWSVREYCSSFGNFFEISNISPVKNLIEEK